MTKGLIQRIPRARKTFQERKHQGKLVTRNCQVCDQKQIPNCGQEDAHQGGSE